MIKYDPTNLGVSALPRGWIRRTTNNQIPYYINTLSNSEPQWTHPDLQQVYSRVRIDHTLPAYPSSAYPIALRLRAVQKRTQLSLLQTSQAMEAYSDHLHTYHHHHHHSHLPSSSSSSSFSTRDLPHLLTPYDTTVLAVDIFQKVEDALKMEASVAGGGVGTLAGGEKKGKFFINAAVELTSSWIRDVFDDAHEGMVTCSSMMLAVLALSSGKLEEKYRALFSVIAGERSGIDQEQLVHFLEQIVQVPQLVCTEQFCSLHALDICARECFKKFVGVGRLQVAQFVSWLQTEPPPLSWLPVLHHLVAAEGSVHEVKCGVCKTTPINGFRYRCIQCSNLDMCQHCYWSGKTTKGHDKSKHYMEEYCLAAKSSDEMKDFFKSFQRSLRRKKPSASASSSSSATVAPLPQHQNQKKRKESLGPASVLSTQSPPTEPRSKTWSKRREGSPPVSRASSVRGEEHHPGRRFTVTEDMQSAWMRGKNKKRSAEEGAEGGGRGKGSGVVSVRGSERGGGRKEVVENANPVRERYNRLAPAPAPGLGATRHVSSSSMMLNEAGRDMITRPHPQQPQDMEASINKLTETTKNLSKHLKHMRRQLSSEEHAPNSSSSDGAVRGEESSEDILKQRNISLQGRVQVLQQHNKRLESCIAQLKLITEMRQQQFSSLPPPPSHSTPNHTPNSSPLHHCHHTPSTTPKSNGLQQHNHHSTISWLNHQPAEMLTQQSHSPQLDKRRSPLSLRREHNHSPQLQNSRSPSSLRRNREGPTPGASGLFMPPARPPRGIPLPQIQLNQQHHNIEQTLL